MGNIGLMAKRPLLTMSFSLALGVTAAHAQTTWFVDDDGSPGDGCTSWADACPELQMALNLASSGDQIWVAQGVYKPDVDVGSGGHTRDQQATFQLLSGVELYGGFGGNEERLEGRVGLFEQTVLSGDLLGNDGPDFENYDDNAWHIVTASGVDRTAKIDGFFVTGGGVGIESTALGGGGFLNVGGKPAVRNCVFVGNVAYGGGAVFNDDQGNATFRDCVFFSNMGGIGGVAYNYRSSPVYRHCTFLSNQSERVAGAVFNSNSDARYVNCLFMNNSSDRGGAVDNQGPNATPLFQHCIFAGNFASQNGGAIYNISDASPTFKECAFYGNTAESAGGAFYSTSARSARLINCVMSGNSAAEGGTIYNRFSSATLTNCSIAYNSASTIAGGIYNLSSSSSLIVTNSVVWGNSTAGVSDEPAQITNDEAALSINYSCVQEWSGVFGGMGNFGDNPRFADADGADNEIGTADDDLRLLFGSPAIDSGNNAVDTDPESDGLQALPYLDFDKRWRFVDNAATPDGGNGDAPIVDLGPYEFGSVPVSARLYVDLEATGNHTGATWSDSLNELRVALDVAHDAAGAVNEVWVAAGTYTPDLGTGDRFAWFQLVSEVSVLGGFDGSEMQASQRDPQANVTILSGDLNGDDGPDFENNAENSYHVMVGQYVDDAVLNGFTIVGGNANAIGTATFNHNGGGLYISESSPHISHCIFSANWAQERGGGALGRIASTTFENCVFERNHATYGGGAFNGVGSPEYINCTFIANTGVWRGAGMANGASLPKLDRCIFVGNTGLANASSRGGGMSNESSSPIIRNSLFMGNSARQGGGGIYNFLSDNVQLFNCTLFNNSAFGFNSTGGGIWDVSSTSEVNSSILWANSDSGGFDETAQIASGMTLVDFSCVQGWTGSFGGDGNIGEDPFFVDPNGPDGDCDTWEDNDVHLLFNSPCVDGGDTERAYDNAEQDIDGEPRIFNDRVDMGADEYFDCNDNESPDYLELIRSTDCNDNDILDECDIADGTSGDCNVNAIPDECESDDDCNTNSIQDICDLADGTSLDCNETGVPDECELADNDCNSNDVPDECEDCNENGWADERDVDSGSSDDCNSNGTPDECEPDCNDNGVADECDITVGVSYDFDDNGVPDECQPDCNDNGFPDFLDIAFGSAEDCNDNAVPDVCDLSDAHSSDCNTNEIPDECDIADQFSDDCDADATPDECEPDNDFDGIPNDCDQLCDYDHDADIDLADYEVFELCLFLSGPDQTPPFLVCLEVFDADASDTIDLRDFAYLQTVYTD